MASLLYNNLMLSTSLQKETLIIYKLSIKGFIGPW